MEQSNISSKQIWFGILLVVLLTAGYFVAEQFAFNKESAVREQIVKEVVKEVILTKRFSRLIIPCRTFWSEEPITLPETW